MAYDIQLGGEGYILKPGAYQRFQDGAGESRIGRVRVFDFFGGGQRAAQLERDRFWHGDGAWPAFDSQGVVPGPKRTDFQETLGSGDEFDPLARTWFTIWDGVCYLAQGDRLYRVNVGTSGEYDGLDHIQTLAADVTDAVATRGLWYFAHGTAAVVSAYTFEEGTYDTEALGNFSTRHTDQIGTHLGRIAFQTVDHWQTDRVSLQEIDSTIRDQRFVQATIRAFVEHRGACWFVTERGLYQFTMGGVHEEDHTANYSAEATLPQTGYEDDLTWVVSHMGSLWLWMGKEVHRYDASNRTFEPMGLGGRATHGAAPVVRYLVVNIEDELTGQRQLWVWDGRGWWLLDEEKDGDTTFGWPVALFGVANNADLLAGRSETANRTGLWQFFQRENQPAYRDTMMLTSSLLDGGERDLEKVWRKVGAIFAWPDDRSGSGEVTARISYSVDGGSTWNVLEQEKISPADRTFEVSGQVMKVERSRWIQLRVELEGVTDWAPVLMGMWAEHETLDLPVRRRRWRFTVECRDTLVLRDGEPNPDGARAIADSLWDLWGDGAVTGFRDVDYDSTLEEYTVRIAGIREVVPKPDRMASDASSEIELTLVEV
jgi:hypothetical protein